MKRDVAFLGLGLLAGLVGGYAWGLRRPASPPPRPGVPAPVRAELPASTTAVRKSNTEGPTVAAPSAADARQQLAAWIAAGCPDKDRRLVRELLTLWSATDPRAALDFVFGAPRFPWRNGALAVPLAAITAHAPNETAAWLRNHLPEQDRGEIAQLVIQQLYKAHPHEALTLAEADQVPVGARFFGLIFGQLARSDPPEALAAFARLSEGGRQESAATLAGAWAETDPVAALHWVESLRQQPGGAEARRGFLLSLAEQSPAETLALLEPWQIDSGLGQHLARSIAEHNPDLALNNLAAFPAAFRGVAVDALADSAFAREPDRIAALARSTLPAAEAQQLIAEAWRRWLGQDRLAAETWATNTPDAGLRASLELAKLRETAESDPSLFLTTADALPAARAEQAMIQSALARVNPDQAADWILRHPEAVEPEFTAQVAAGYFEWNRSQAGAWVDRLPASPGKDRAQASLALRWSQAGDAALAARSLTAIADPQLQTGTRFQVFRTLNARDSAAAARWLASQPVSPEIRANWAALVAHSDRDPFAPDHFD